MPLITQTGSYDQKTPGFEFLSVDYDGSADRVLLFAGSTLPTTLEIKYTDDEGVEHALENGTITSLPKSILIQGVRRPLKIVATGGAPNFSVVSG